METNRASYPREVFYEKTGPASYLALQNSVTLFDNKAGYCLEVVGISSEEVETFVLSIHCSNDCAQRNFRLTQDFVNGYKNEDKNKPEARDNGKEVEKGLTKQHLKNV